MPDINPEEFPSNSYSQQPKERPEPSEPPKKVVTMVAQAKIVKKKKPFMQSFAEGFFGDIGRGIFNYIIYDVLIPSATDAIEDAVHGALDMVFHPGTDPRYSRHRSNPSGVTTQIRDYSSISRHTTRAQPERRVATKARDRFDDVAWDTRDDAEDALESMKDLLENYGQVTVSDFNQIAGLDDQYTDNQYGWVALGNARVVRNHGGYIIDLPPIKYLGR